MSHNDLEVVYKYHLALICSSTSSPCILKHIWCHHKYLNLLHWSQTFTYSRQSYCGWLIVFVIFLRTHPTQYILNLVDGNIHGNSPLRYVSVIWFIFQVLQLLLVRYIQQDLKCISKPTMKHMQKPDWKSDLPLTSNGYKKCMFVDFWTTYIGPPNCVHYGGYRIIINIWRCSGRKHGKVTPP